MHQSAEQIEAQRKRMQQWADQLIALGERLWDADREHDWIVCMYEVPQLTIEVSREAREFVRFVRDEAGIIGVFADGRPIRFASTVDAYDAAVARRMTSGKPR